jgi:GDP-L-fucose synthase
LVNPVFVIHLAAKVGGLFRNMNNKIEMYLDNIKMNNNVLEVCHKLKVTKVVSCLSTCIFPDKVEYPINETMLHIGEPHSSNNTYSYAKRMLDILSKAYQEQYDDNFICIIPTNIYGPNDNFNLEDSHVIPGLIHKCYLAKKNNEPFVIYGSGSPLRQFIYSIDLARLILWSLFVYDKRDTIILSNSEKDELSIKTVAIEIASIFEYDNIKFDTTRSDGQYRKTADNSKLLRYLPDFKFTDIKTGLKETIVWFNKNYDSARK